MKRILFVDDEPKVLGGLCRMLRGLRREWDMVFVESGPEAMTLLATSPFDVIVTDIRMPYMDGAQLLGHVAEVHPAVVRIILSGQCERSAVLKCVGPAHLFLTKPCDSELLKSTIARACLLRDRLSSEEAQEAVSSVQTLRSQPELFVELSAELHTTTASIHQVAKIIAQDPAMTAKILQLVSSGFFGTPQRIHDLNQAVHLLGVETMRALLEQTDAFAPLSHDSPRKDLWDLFRKHCLSVAEAAKKIAQSETSDTTMIGNTYLAGMLHDIAIYVFVKDSIAGYVEALSLASAEHTALTEMEERIFHARRDNAGAYLMGLWGLSDQIVNAIDHHLCPRDSSDQVFSPLAAVHVANAVMEAEIADVIGTPNPIDSGFLERIGCLDRLDAWREICLSTITTEGVLT